MLNESLQNLLKNITIYAIGKAVFANDDIAVLSQAIASSAAERAIVENVQFESCWQDQIDNSDTFYLFTELKLSPSLCALAYENGYELNNLGWHFILPNINYLTNNQKPKTSVEWLSLAQVEVKTDLSDDEFYFLKSLLLS